MLCTQMHQTVHVSGYFEICIIFLLSFPYQLQDNFWGNSSNCFHVFWLQKWTVRIITGSRPSDTYRRLFKKLRLLPLQCQYILSLSLFVMNNKNLYHINSEIHAFNTMKNSNLHQPQANPSLYQREVYSSGINVFNSLPSNIKNLFFHTHNVHVDNTGKQISKKILCL